MGNTLGLDRTMLAARCHEIQSSLGKWDIPEFESVTEIGMAVRLALHIRGLPLIKYEIGKLVAQHYLEIPSIVFRRILEVLEEISFVRLVTEGNTIKSFLPTVPYYEDLYERLGEYAEAPSKFNEAEQLALVLVNRLAKSPENIDSLRNNLGADKTLLTRGIDIGIQCSFLIQRRARGKNILLNPTYFSENDDIFADGVAAQGAPVIANTLELLKKAQGWPLTLIETTYAIGGHPITPEQVGLLKRLAQDGVVKPPSIHTSYAGDNHFMFTPTPSGSALNPTKRDIYEKSMAIVSALRQGQLMPNKYAIRSPIAVLSTLQSNLRLGKATQEATQQYKNLVHLRIGRLRNVGNGYSSFEVIDTPENREALSIARYLLEGDEVQGMEVDDQARSAFQQDQRYIESIISQAALRQHKTIDLPQPLLDELDIAIYGAVR